MVVSPHTVPFSRAFGILNKYFHTEHLRVIIHFDTNYRSGTYHVPQSNAMYVDLTVYTDSGFINHNPLYRSTFRNTTYNYFIQDVDVLDRM